MMHYAYKWSFCFIIEPSCIVMIRIWIGDDNWTWYAKRPLTIAKGGFTEDV